jgi:hypothetical protein
MALPAHMASIRVCLPIMISEDFNDYLLIFLQTEAGFSEAATAMASIRPSSITRPLHCGIFTTSFSVSSVALPFPRDHGPIYD